MDIWSQLIQGFVTAGTPVNLLWAFVGCALGTAVGVLPGIGPATAVAMLLPITAKVDATASMIFFAGIYYGAMYGGSTTSILLNTPGETSSMVTAMEGNKMAKSGRAGQALATAAIGSFVAGTIATVVVTLFAFVRERVCSLRPVSWAWSYLAGAAALVGLGVDQQWASLGVAAAAITYAGLAFVFVSDFSSGGANITLGTALVLASAVCFAVYQLLAKRLIAQMGAAMFTSFALSGAAITTLAHVFIMRGGLDTALSANYFMLAAATGLLATVVPSFFVNAGMARIGAATQRRASSRARASPWRRHSCASRELPRRWYAKKRSRCSAGGKRQSRPPTSRSSRASWRP